MTVRECIEKTGYKKVRINNSPYLCDRSFAGIMELDDERLEKWYDNVIVAYYVSTKVFPDGVLIIENGKAHRPDYIKWGIEEPTLHIYDDGKRGSIVSESAIE